MVRPLSPKAHVFTPVSAACIRQAPALQGRHTPARPDAAPPRGQPLQTLHATDPRWVLALRTAVTLTGGVAAILTPDNRRSLETIARRLGLRPFDAALVFAIVQDAARRGESIADRGASPAVVERLRLVRPADPAESSGPLWCAATAAVLSVVLFAAAMLALSA